MKPEPTPPRSPCSACGRRDGWTRSPTKHKGGWTCACREVPDPWTQRYRTNESADSAPAGESAEISTTV